MRFWAAIWKLSLIWVSAPHSGLIARGVSMMYDDYQGKPSHKMVALVWHNSYQCCHSLVILKVLQVQYHDVPRVWTHTSIYLCLQWKFQKICLAPRFPSAVHILMSPNGGLCRCAWDASSKSMDATATILPETRDHWKKIAMQNHVEDGSENIVNTRFPTACCQRLTVESYIK